MERVTEIEPHDARALAESLRRVYDLVAESVTEDNARSPLVAKVTDPVVRQFWAQVDGLSDNELAQRIQAPLDRWRSLMSNSGLRRVFGQPRPAFDLAHHLNHGGVVIVPLNA